MKNNIKNDFPFFQLRKNVIYLNSSFTSLKPNSVLNAIHSYYSGEDYNPEKTKFSDYQESLSQTAMRKIEKFLNAEENSLIPVGGSTDGLNKLAKSLVSNLDQEDEIIIGDFEHASNFLPWIKFGKKKKINIKYYQLNSSFTIDLDHLKTLISKKTKILALTHIYNTFGTENDIKKIKKLLKDYAPNCLLIVDGTQAVGHMRIDLKDLKADAYIFSSHKMMGPEGIGMIYLSKNLQENLDPFIYGGKMNINYDHNNIIYKKGIKKFYGGTPNISGLVGLAAACEYISQYGIEKINSYGFYLKHTLEGKLKEINNIEIINKNIDSHILLFRIKDIPEEDVVYYLEKNNVLVSKGPSCVKTGFNQNINLEKVIRISFHLYNDLKDIEQFIEILKKGDDFIDEILK